jgi:hypothetical protein
LSCAHKLTLCALRTPHSTPHACVTHTHACAHARPHACAVAGAAALRHRRERARPVPLRQDLVQGPPGAVQVWLLLVRHRAGPDDRAAARGAGQQHVGARVP